MDRNALANGAGQGQQILQNQFNDNADFSKKALDFVSQGNRENKNTEANFLDILKNQVKESQSSNGSSTTKSNTKANSSNSSNNVSSPETKNNYKNVENSNISVDEFMDNLKKAKETANKLNNAVDKVKKDENKDTKVDESKKSSNVKETATSSKTPIQKFDDVWKKTEHVEFKMYGGQEMRKSTDGKIIALKSDFDIDTDGSGPTHGDTGHRPETSMQYKDGSHINSDITSYYVLPKSFAEKCGAKLGDLAAVKYKDKFMPAVFADFGPEGMIGEGSYSLSQGLGINPDPNGTGSFGDVQWLIFPGSGEGKEWTPENSTKEGLMPQVEKLLDEYSKKEMKPFDNYDTNKMLPEEKGKSFYTFGHKAVNGKFYDEHGTWLDTGTTVTKEQALQMPREQRRDFLRNLGIIFLDE